MTIQEIYKDQKPFFEEQIAKMYNAFVKEIESDPDYSLGDDELTELFDELLLDFWWDTTPEAERDRVIDKHYEGYRNCLDCGQILSKDEQVETQDNKILCGACDTKRLIKEH